MSNEKKRGRPKLADPRRFQFNFKLNSEDIALLDAIANETGLRRTDVVRLGLKKLYEERIKK